MANLVQIDILKERVNVGSGQRVTPVFELRVARKQQFLAAGLKKEDETRVVHLLVKRANKLERLLATGGFETISQPPDLARELATGTRRVPGEERLGGLLQAITGFEASQAELPILRLVSRALLSNRVRLLQCWRAQDSDLYSWKNLLKPGRATMVGVNIAPHRRKILDRRFTA